MRWRKLGQVFAPDNNFPWLVSHAANPFAVNTGGGLFRVYFTGRDTQSRSNIGALTIDMEDSFKVTELFPEPIITPGEPGIFDDSGTAMGYYIEIRQVPHIYYLGWNLKKTVPWLNTIGLAKFDAATCRFQKTSRAPVMDRSDEDPFSISYPSILFENGVYRMWYGSNLQWGALQHEMNHVFKYAESEDGINWKRSGRVVVDLMHPNEYALSKPFVIKKEGTYHMWYSYRGNGAVETYRIGYAGSVDGMNWQRKDDEAGIDVSAEGWDSEMICYPCIFDYNNNTYMLYNGNGYGRTGFGIAILEK